MAKDESIKKIVNTIRANASNGYQEAVAYMDANSKIEDLENPIMSYSPIKNEFVDGLTNMIGMTIFTTLNTYQNPLQILQKGEKPLGIDVREIATDLVKSTKYDLSNEGIAEALQLAPPVMEECIHRVNRQEKYQLTISNAELRLAFNSWDDLNKLVVDKAQLLYSSNFRDEFEWTKDLLRETVQRGYVTTLELDKAVEDDASGKAFVKTVKNVVSKFKFPSNQNNQLANMDTDARITTWTAPEDTYVITTATILNNIDVDTMAMAFNRDALAFKAGNTVEVDSLGYILSDGKYYAIDAIVCDKAFTQIYNDLTELWEMELASVMAWNRFLHVWQVYSTSPFVNVNAIVHEVSEDEIPDGYFDMQTKTTDNGALN